MARQKYFACYVQSSSHHINMWNGGGGVVMWDYKNAVIAEHPVIWASRKGRTLTFWSEIPEEAYRAAKDAEMAKAEQAKAAKKLKSWRR